MVDVDNVKLLLACYASDMSDIQVSSSGPVEIEAANDVNADDSDDQDFLQGDFMDTLDVVDSCYSDPEAAEYVGENARLTIDFEDLPVKVEKEGKESLKENLHNTERRDRRSRSKDRTSLRDSRPTSGRNSPERRSRRSRDRDTHARRSRDRDTQARRSRDRDTHARRSRDREPYSPKSRDSRVSRDRDHDSQRRSTERGISPNSRRSRDHKSPLNKTSVKDRLFTATERKVREERLYNSSHNTERSTPIKDRLYSIPTNKDRRTPVKDRLYSSSSSKNCVLRQHRRTSDGTRNDRATSHDSRKSSNRDRDDVKNTHLSVRTEKAVRRIANAPSVNDRSAKKVLKTASKTHLTVKGLKVAPIDDPAPPGTEEVLLPDLELEESSREISKNMIDSNVEELFEITFDTAEKRRRTISGESRNSRKRRRSNSVDHYSPLRERDRMSEERLSRELSEELMRDQDRDLREIMRERKRGLEQNRERRARSRERLSRERRGMAREMSDARRESALLAKEIQDQKYENEKIKREMREEFERTKRLSSSRSYDRERHSSERQHSVRRYTNLSPVSNERMSRRSNLSFEMSPDPFDRERSLSMISSGSHVSRSRSPDDGRGRRRKRSPFLKEMERKLGITLTGDSAKYQYNAVATSHQHPTSQGLNEFPSAHPNMFTGGVPPPLAPSYFPPAHGVNFSPAPVFYPAPISSNRPVGPPKPVPPPRPVPPPKQSALPKPVAPPRQNLLLKPAFVFSAPSKAELLAHKDTPEAPPPPQISGPNASMSLSSLLEASVRVGARCIDVNSDRVSRCDDAIRAFRADDFLSPSVLSSGRFVVRPPPSLVQYTSKTRFDHPAQESMIKLKSPLLRSSLVKMSFTDPPPPVRKPVVAKPVVAKPLQKSNAAKLPVVTPAVKPPTKNIAQPFDLSSIPKSVVDQLYSDIDVAIIAEVKKSSNRVIDTLDLEPMEELSSGEEDFLDGVPDYDQRCASCVERGQVVMVSVATQCRAHVNRSVETQTDFNEVVGSGVDVQHRHANTFPSSSFGSSEPYRQSFNSLSYNSVAMNQFPVVKSDEDAKKDEGFQVKIAELSMQYEMFKASLNSDSSTPAKVIGPSRYTGVNRSSGNSVPSGNNPNNPAQQSNRNSVPSGNKPNNPAQQSNRNSVPSGNNPNNPAQQANRNSVPSGNNPSNPATQANHSGGNSVPPGKAKGSVPNLSNLMKVILPPPRQKKNPMKPLFVAKPVNPSNIQIQLHEVNPEHQSYVIPRPGGGIGNVKPQQASGNLQHPQPSGGNKNFKPQLPNSSNATNAAVAPVPTFKQSFNKVSEACNIPSAFGGGANFFPSNPSPLVLDTKQYPFQLNPYTRPPLTSPGGSAAPSETAAFASFSATTSFPSQSSFIQPPGRLQPSVNDGQQTFHLPFAAFGAPKSAANADPFNITQKKPYGTHGNQSMRGKW